MLLINHGKVVIFLRTFSVYVLHSFVANQPVSGAAISDKLAEHGLVLYPTCICRTVCHYAYVVLSTDFSSKCFLFKFTNNRDHLHASLVISVGGC